MQKTGEQKYDLSLTQNRELSWLDFNQRVLEEAADPSVPLLERLRFISIFSSNLDEFFMVRVGGLFNLDLMSPDAVDNKSGLTAKQQLSAVFKRVKQLVEMRDSVYSALLPKLHENGVIEADIRRLDKQTAHFISDYCRDVIKPVVSPQIIDISHPFPHLKNKALYIAALLAKGGRELLGIIDIPDSIPPIIFLPGNPRKFVRTEELLLNMAESLFPLYKIKEKAVISVTRNADIDFNRSEDFPDFRSKMSQLLKKRERLSPVRLEINGREGKISGLLTESLGISREQAYFCKCPLKLGYSYILDGYEPSLYNPPRAPLYPEYLDPSKSMIKQIREKDRLLFYPYDSMQPFQDLLKEAAADPQVVSIKITIYRLAKNSVLIRHLCEAAENGKEVTVLMELRARFDEKHNIEWAKVLEEAGCRILYGPEDLKCHAKICLITLNGKSGVSYITQIGTGNYNEKTSALYTDFSLLTASEEIGRDSADFFRNMLTGNFYSGYNCLLAAPGSMRDTLLKLMDDEIKKGPSGRIIIKINSLTERCLIDKLSEASCAGVRVDLIVRGICCLLPGVEGKTENIRVTGIVGRYLEHSRVYCFGSGKDQKLYIASADWMTRNQRRRIEIACPIYDPDIKKWLGQYLEILLSDTEKARLLTPMGTYVKKAPGKTPPFNSQEYFFRHRPLFYAMQNKKAKGILSKLRGKIFKKQ